jgi:hypothetical protein
MSRDTETAIAIGVMVLLIALLLVLVRRMRTTKHVMVSEDLVIGGSAPEVEPAVVAALSSVEGAQHLAVAPGRHAVVIRRVPVWATVPIFLMFPVGLVFLFVRESVRLDVALFDGPAGAVVRLSGPTEHRTLERVRSAIGALDRHRANIA